MKPRKKFFLATAAVASAACCLFGLAACGEEGEEKSIFVYELNADGNSYSVTGILSAEETDGKTDVVVPSEYIECIHRLRQAG